MALAHSRPHNVVATCDITTGEVLRYGAVQVGGKPLFDPDTECVKIVGEAENFSAAVRLQKSLETWSIKRFEAAALEDTSFDTRLPDDPMLRSAAYRSLTPDLQQAIVYTALCTTGLPLKKVAAWLCVKPAEVTSVCSEEVAAAARAELDLRIARKMVQFAMQSKSPAAMSATLYLTKVFLKWNEAGMDAAAEATNKNVLDIKLNVVSNSNDAVNELRADLDAMVELADKKAQMRLQ